MSISAGLGQKVRVFIGTEPKTEIARKVMEFSLRRHTDAEVTCVSMLGPEWEYPTDGFKQGTGFSLRRWMIPEYCGWEGYAIYVDADQIAFGDIYDIWQIPERSKDTKCPAWMTYQPSKFSAKPHPHSSVMVINCAAAKALPYFHLNNIINLLREKPDKKTYADLMFPTWFTPGRLGVEWNHLNVYQPGKTKILHYTKEPEQPWYKPDHPLARLWYMELQAAISSGVVTENEIIDAVGQFGVKQDWRPTNGLHPHYLTCVTSKDGKFRLRELGMTIPKITKR